ncbi:MULTISPECIES: GNAT family N-acetyltransferase [unclassified Novosphingobium]|uniref:GNAT family N-acetyltransferase n=1 Tax=unclassified Novosphingobium TaxID=2644732 RepID=UPI000ED93EC3|nr:MULTISPECIES: GNAT family N-acetyltransferase [unclassified Novosphingobium]HCF24073.1 GNAT family N-acetyltransferase [Novosphingobium sp.]HQV04413.1 GNAT family N-acetyltransferase [Novosphingobium sp.]
MEPEIIQLGAAHRDRAVATLAAAFHDDPAMVYMLPDPASRARRLARLIGWMVDQHLKIGLVLGTPEVSAVTLWREPGRVHYHEPLWHPGAVRFLPIFGRHLPRALRTDDGITTHLPKGEEWIYLKMAGVHPEHQGKGLGGAMIRTGLARGAKRGVPSVLETATPSNVGLYQRLGYAIISEWDVAGGGPHFWTMATGR